MSVSDRELSVVSRRTVGSRISGTFWLLIDEKITLLGPTRVFTT